MKNLWSPRSHSSHLPRFLISQAVERCWQPKIVLSFKYVDGEIKVTLKVVPSMASAILGSASPSANATSIDTQQSTELMLILRPASVLHWEDWESRKPWAERALCLLHGWFEFLFKGGIKPETPSSMRADDESPDYKGWQHLPLFVLPEHTKECILTIRYCLEIHTFAADEPKDVVVATYALNLIELEDSVRLNIQLNFVNLCYRGVAQLSNFE
jgi:hypothetical protein